MKRIVSIFVLFCMVVFALNVSVVSVSAAQYESLKYRVEDGAVVITDTTSGISGEVEIPAYINGYPVTKINSAAFQYSVLVKGVTIPNTVTHIGGLAFQMCSGLKSINIPDSVKTIWSRAFADCSSVKTLKLGKGVQTIGAQAFEDCNMTSVVVPSSVTDMGSGVFNGCYSLSTIYCEASSKPSGWSDSWLDGCNATVVWGYHEHSYTGFRTYIEPTCTESGEMRNECVYCGDYDSFPISATGHTEGEWITTVEPEIGKRGIREVYCVTCGELIESQEIPALDECPMGDINADLNVDQYDYILAKRIHFNTYTPDDNEKYRGDVNRDGNNDQYDYILIKRHHFGNYTIV